MESPEDAGLIDRSMPAAESAGGGAAVGRLRARIAAGDYGPDGRLPSERRLIAEMGVGRTELRKALETLEREGAIWRHVGKGTFVHDRGGEPTTAIAGLARQTTPVKMMRARLAIEPAIAREAAINASAEALARMRVARERAQAAASWRAYEVQDDAFHRSTRRGERQPAALGDLRSAERHPPRRGLGQRRAPEPPAPARPPELRRARAYRRGDRRPRSRGAPRLRCGCTCDRSRPGFSANEEHHDGPRGRPTTTMKKGGRTMNPMRRTLLAAVAALAAGGLGWSGPAAAQAEPIRVAFGDIATVETLNFLIAVERTKERGVPMEVTYFKEEDIAAQAVVSGQADVGVGAPYTVLAEGQGADPDLLPDDHAALLPGGQHRDLPGLEGPRRPGDRGAVARLGHRGDHAADGQAARHRLLQHLLRAGLRGARHRAAAGHVNATIVDFDQLADPPGEGRRQVQAASTIENVDATDEALYANTDFLEERAADVQSSSRSWSGPGARSTRTRRSSASCASKYNLLPGPARGRARRGRALFRGGRSRAASSRSTAASRRPPRPTSSSSAAAGKLEGDPAAVDPRDFWDFTALEAAKAVRRAECASTSRDTAEPGRSAARSADAARPVWRCRPSGGWPRGAVLRRLGDRRADRSASPSRPSSRPPAALGGMIADGSMAAAYLRTLQPLVIGARHLAASSASAPASPWACGATWNGWSLPIFITMQAAPMAALIPLITFVYGIGLTSKVLAVCILAHAGDRAELLQGGAQRLARRSSRCAARSWARAASRSPR